MDALPLVVSRAAGESGGCGGAVAADQSVWRRHLQIPREAGTSDRTLIVHGLRW
jgi:hypothetical protein